MAAIALTTAARVRVVQSLLQDTLVAAETIVAGAPIRIDTNGKATNSNATDTTENRVYGLATKSVIAGEALTVIRKGVMDGYVFTQAYNAIIYLSDTDGTLADAAGTVSTIVGRVISVTGTTLGTAYDKVLSVEL